MPTATSGFRKYSQGKRLLRFQNVIKAAMSSRCHGAEWPNFSLEHKARSLEASSNIRRNHSTHHPLFFGCLDSLQILFAWAVDKIWRIWILLKVWNWDFSILYSQDFVNFVIAISHFNTDRCDFSMSTGTPNLSLNLERRFAMMCIIMRIIILIVMVRYIMQCWLQVQLNIK